MQILQLLALHASIACLGWIERGQYAGEREYQLTTRVHPRPVTLIQQ